jgi:hypothetical protein
MALMVLIRITISLLRKPQELLVLSPPTPSVPMIAKAEPPPSRNAPANEILRRPQQLPEVLPVILSPPQDGTVEREHLEFSWKPVSRSRYYGIRVVTSDGDLLWEGQTEGSALHFPSDVVLKGGSYFVWITAYLTDGQVAKSSPVRFLVKR